MAHATKIAQLNIRVHPEKLKRWKRASKISVVKNFTQWLTQAADAKAAEDLRMFRDESQQD